MTTVVTRGAASAQALGYASSSAAVNFIEDVFSTYLYTGNGATQTITNGIDLAGEGGLVWLKRRGAADNNFLWDTARGAAYGIISNNAGAQGNYGTAGLSAFNSTGFSLGSYDPTNGSTAGNTYASWTFRKQPKFFDIVTYTGDGVAGRTVAHNLGSVPGCIIVKATSVAGQDWLVYHRSLATNGYLLLNSTGAASVYPYVYNPTTTTFDVASSVATNGSGTTYVAYLFAHNAGGFGLTGTDNVISCGSYTNDAGGNPTTVNLGYEPQWVMFKRTDSDTFGNWYMVDNMRGFLDPSGSSWLWANANNAEQKGLNFAPTATGFTTSFISGATFIYIAIRRGPMKVPTDATKVFAPATRTGTGADIVLTSAGFPVDLAMLAARSGTYSATVATYDRLRGATQYIRTAGTNAEQTVAAGLTSFSSMNGVSLGAGGAGNVGSEPYVDWYFRRAPGFFDEVCYTGTGVDRTVTHNLGVVPELMIVKARANARNWTVYSAATGNTGFLILNNTAAYEPNASTWGTTLTSSVFSVGGNYTVNDLNAGMVAYLFATAAGVSKVGSYTGTGTTLQINCGFTSGARFVLIKRTDSAGDWYVWDSARGIVAGNDPYLLLNTTAAEVTSTDYVDTYSAGFEISSTAPAAINANGGSFIFFAVA